MDDCAVCAAEDAAIEHWKKNYWRGEKDYWIIAKAEMWEFVRKFEAKHGHKPEQVVWVVQQPYNRGPIAMAGIVFHDT